ncbi:MAG: hypothetical protein Q9195_004532 [Heterodermia aff. obscurata]
MTSRRKIATIHKHAQRLSLTLVLKTGRPPGIMLAEAMTHDAMEQWIGSVRRLRYKDFRVAKIEEITDGGDGVSKLSGAGQVREFEEIKELGAYLQECGIWHWWREHMGFAKSGS